MFSLSEQQARCSQELGARTNVTKVTILLHESNTESDLRFCHYQASYTIQQTKKTIFTMTDCTYTKNQKFYLRYTSCLETCQSVWTGEVFKLPGFGKQEFKVSPAELNKVKSDRIETNYGNI